MKFEKIILDYFSVRKVIHWFVCAPAFDKFIMIVIVFSSLAIAAEDPVDEDNPRNYYLSKADYVFTITFACEVCLKVGIIAIWSIKCDNFRIYSRGGIEES